MENFFQVKINSLLKCILLTLDLSKNLKVENLEGLQVVSLSSWTWGSLYPTSQSSQVLVARYCKDGKAWEVQKHLHETTVEMNHFIQSRILFL